jgi:hypothetical protein
VEVVDDVAEVPVEDDVLLVLVTLVPEPSGVAPPPAIIVDEPPVAGTPVLEGIATVVVEVVTVVWTGVTTAGVVDALWRTSGCTDGAITVGAASSGGSTLAAASCRAPDGVT